MSAVTQCPECSTRFKVSQEQLEAHQGMVRCGRCQAAFNALKYLHGGEPSPQLDLPIMQEETAPPAPEAPGTPIETAHAKIKSGHSGSTEPSAASLANGDRPPLVTAAQEEVLPAGDEEALTAAPQKKRPAWPWAVASAALLLLLLAQATYFFRVELAAHMPGLKPMLVGYCSLLQCSVPLPQDADLMSIESSDLEADPAQASVIILTATLRNRAPYAQAYPNLELTLNDINDKPVARRTFYPAEYLQSGVDEKPGLAGKRELGIKLNLDTTDLKPSGYRLLLFYPK